MRKPANWSDEYWLPLLQLYLKKPTGMKSLYSRPLVELGMELHLTPQTIYTLMHSIHDLDSPLLRRLWDTYATRREMLNNDVDQMRRMRGFGSEASFYDGVDEVESFEKDFRPIVQDVRLTPVMLIMAIDLYFRLTPNTMVVETPEVRELAKLMRIDDALLVEVLREYIACDPCLQKPEVEAGRLHEPCMDVWRRFGQMQPQHLAARASLLSEYFKAPPRGKRK